MKKFLPLFLAFLFLLSSCELSPIEVLPEGTNFTSEKTVNNDSFGIAFAAGESADPYTTPNKINSELMGLLCEPLFSLSPDFEPVAVLCSDYSYSDKTYRFNIKNGVTFSDGSPLTAADVEYSLKAAMEPGSYYRSRFSCVESISHSKSNNYVTVKLRYDNVRFPALLDIPIIKSGTRKNALPTGSGLYAPKDDFSSLVARNNHHSGLTPLYPSISLVNVSSTDELIFKFDTHSVSVLSSDPTSSSPISPASAAQMINVPTTQLHYIGFNARSGPTSNAELRRLIACAIDRESAAESDFALMGRAAALPLHPSSPSYPHEIAARLSYENASRFPEEISLSILVNSENPGKLAACKRISESLTRLGAPTTVRALPFEEYSKALRNGDFSLYYAEVSINSDFDITQLLSGSLNFGGCYDAGLSSLHSAYLSGDEAKKDFFTKFCDLCPFAPIMFKDSAIYTEQDFFKTCTPTSHNIYHDFSLWTLGG